MIGSNYPKKATRNLWKTLAFAIWGHFSKMCFTVTFYEKSNTFLKILRVSEPGYTPECYFGDFIKSD